jgi:hypothetical protein
MSSSTEGGSAPDVGPITISTADEAITAQATTAPR